MATFKNDDGTLALMATPLIEQYHAPLNAFGVRIDYVFAFGERDEETGELKSPALMNHGVQALGICKKLNLKDRAKGNGDAEICVDGDWWEHATVEQQRAVLDHELEHILVDDRVDAQGRPKLKLKPHDYQIGWFNNIARRHGKASVEMQQATVMMEEAGQLYWPEITEADVNQALEVVPA